MINILKELEKQWNIKLPELYDYNYYTISNTMLWSITMHSFNGSNISEDDIIKYFIKHKDRFNCTDRMIFNFNMFISIYDLYVLEKLDEINVHNENNEKICSIINNFKNTQELNITGKIIAELLDEKFNSPFFYQYNEFSLYKIPNVNYKERFFSVRQVENFIEQLDTMIEIYKNSKY